MIAHQDIDDIALRSRLRKGLICFGGNRKLRIYGLLLCKSGKRMKPVNRVFFASEKEALDNGYRPCGNCMREAYNKSKDGLIWLQYR